MTMATKGPFTEYDWAGETRYDVDKVICLFVHHAELAALARGVVDDVDTAPEAVKGKTTLEEVTVVTNPGPAATTPHSPAQRRSTMSTKSTKSEQPVSTPLTRSLESIMGEAILAGLSDEALDTCQRLVTPLCEMLEEIEADAEDREARGEAVDTNFATLSADIEALTALEARIGDLMVRWEAAQAKRQG
jgi:hypothetical protein